MTQADVAGIMGVAQTIDNWEGAGNKSKNGDAFPPDLRLTIPRDEHGGTAPGRRANTSGNFPEVSKGRATAEAAAERQGKRTDLQPTGKFPVGDGGRAKDKAAKAVGWSGKTFEKANTSGKFTEVKG